MCPVGRPLTTFYGLGMDALVTVCPRNLLKHEVVVWDWCSGHHMLLEHECHCCESPGTRPLIMGGAWMRCSRHHMLLEHEHYSRFGHGCSVHCMLLESPGTRMLIMFWARMLYSLYAPGKPRLAWFGHGCSCHRMLLEHALFNACA